jgi:hypothetical protein
MANPSGSPPPDGQRCTATAKTTGERCKKTRKPGQKVCGSHGGEAPQNKKAALERLREAIDPLTAKKVQAADDCWQKYMEAKEEDDENRMSHWLDKFNDMYEQVADRAGPPKVKRSEHTGEDGGAVQTSGVMMVPGMQDEEKWEDEQGADE